MYIGIKTNLHIYIPVLLVAAQGIPLSATVFFDQLKYHR